MLCSAGYKHSRSKHKCVITVLPAWWPKSLTLLQQCLNSALSCLGLSLLFYKVHYSELDDTCCVHSFFHQHSGDMGLQEAFPFNGNGKLQYYHSGKTLTPFLTMHLSFPPCCLSSLSSPSIPINQTWQKQHGAVCYDLSPRVPLPTISSCQSGNSAHAASKILSSLSQSALKR